ncbi:hypothetical protein CR513_30457, partial [Mucuna pruriens]
MSSSPYLISYDYLSSQHKSYALFLSTITKPTSYDQAVRDTCWVNVMNAELKTLEANKTWQIVEKPPGVYKIKRKSNGSIERYKARLVAKGYMQTEGVDFFDTFSPVAKVTSMQLLLALASTQNWLVHQLDVNNALLHGELEEDVYMEVPEGVNCKEKNKVCKLLKSFYGLKQASRKWYEKLSSLLILLGYKQATIDYSLFTKSVDHTFTTLLIYVDDIVLVGNSLDEIVYIKSTLDQHFGIKDLGVLNSSQATHSSKGISLCQRQYCLDLLVNAGVLGIYEDLAGYRRLIGRLLYLTTTRPNINYAVQQLSQFHAQPTMMHYQAAQRVFKFLNRSTGKGLFFSRSSSLQLLGFAYAD